MVAPATCSRECWKALLLRSTIAISAQPGKAPAPKVHFANVGENARKTRLRKTESDKVFGRLRKPARMFRGRLSTTKRTGSAR
jgi:hypothetical protein